jgi:hypothetical protein
MGQTLWLTLLRQSGAQIDSSGVSTIKTVRAPRQAAAMDFSDAPALAPSRRRARNGVNGWFQPAVVEPEPAPTPAPETRARRNPTPAPLPFVARDAQGKHWSLLQAQKMLKQGYHVQAVIKKTGWGRSWFEDMIDKTGYIDLSRI